MITETEVVKMLKGVLRLPGVSLSTISDESGVERCRIWRVANKKTKVYLDEAQVLVDAIKKIKRKL